MNANLPTMAVNTNASILWGAISVLALLAMSCKSMEELAKVCLLLDYAPASGKSSMYTYWKTQCKADIFTTNCLLRTAIF